MAHPEAERIEVWLQDEARIGQSGRNCRKWFQRGTRPTGVKDQRHTAVYLFGAVCPERDAAFGLVLPIVSTNAMQTFLDQLSDQVAPKTHALVLMDRAAIGLGSVFMHLKAEINWHQMFRDLIDDFDVDALAARQVAALEAAQLNLSDDADAPKGREPRSA